MDNQELMRSLQEVMKTLAKKWGAGTKTPFGAIVVCGVGPAHATQTTWSHPDGWGTTISVYSYGDRYWARRNRDMYEASTDDLEYLARQLAAMAQYLAGRDFQKKVEGSVSLLKCLNKALGG